MAGVMCPRWPHDHCFSSISPDLRRHIWTPRGSGTRSFDEVRCGHFFGGLKDTPPKVEYPAVRHGAAINAAHRRQFSQLRVESGRFASALCVR